MANFYEGNPIVLDTFDAAIDFATAFPHGMQINSIEWSKPTDTSHTCYVQHGGSSGPKLFDEQCTVANQSVIKYFHGEPFKALYIPAASGVLLGSGTLIITLWRMAGKTPQ